MRTDRWNKKRELNLYAFYDHTGLERHLEKMAANGWMLESVGTYALRYRRCEPKKLRFAVVYYPKTDSFCPDEPKPPTPRSVSSSSSTSTGVHREMGWMMSWAMRSPTSMI